jgi:serine/threonine-protein kinase
MHKIRLEKAPPIRRFNPTVPRELERLVSRCLEKRKEDRWKSTQDLILSLERFLAKRVEMNYHAALVLFLRDQRVLSTDEADAQLHPAIAGGYKQPAPYAVLGGPFAWPALRKLVSTQAMILGAMIVLLAFLHASQIGVAAPPPRPVAALPPPLPPPPPGFLRVLVEPWAEVWVDGKLVDTTPFAKPLSLPEGKHTLKLHNPFFADETRTVDVKRGATETLRVALTRK